MWFLQCSFHCSENFKSKTLELVLKKQREVVTSLRDAYLAKISALSLRLEMPSWDLTHTNFSSFFLLARITLIADVVKKINYSLHYDLVEFNIKITE